VDEVEPTLMITWDALLVIKSGFRSFFIILGLEQAVGGIPPKPPRIEEQH
jgi:hypothetical protein